MSKATGEQRKTEESDEIDQMLGIIMDQVEAATWWCGVCDFPNDRDRACCHRCSNSRGSPHDSDREA